MVLELVFYFKNWILLYFSFHDDIFVCKNIVGAPKKLFSLCFPICAYGQSFGEFTLPQMSRRYIVLCLFQSIFAELNEDLHCFVFAIVKYYFHSSQFVRNKCIAHHVICMLCVSFHFQVNCSFSLYKQS